MKSEFETAPILTWVRLPLRLSRRECAQLLNFRDDDAIGVLVRARLLKPLGEPPEGAPMWFATSEILKLAEDLKWLGKATKAVRGAVMLKNAKKTELRPLKVG